jgi:hypothetical protein
MSHEDLWRLCITNTNTKMIQEEDLSLFKKCDGITLIRNGRSQHTLEGMNIYPRLNAIWTERLHY